MCLSVCILPLEMPEKICSCATGSLSVNTGKVVAVVTMNGKNNMNLREHSDQVAVASISHSGQSLFRYSQTSEVAQW